MPASFCCLLSAITGSGGRCFCLQRLSGLVDLLQPVLAPPQLLDLLLQLRLGFEYPLVAHSIVLGGIGLHLGAVQRHMAQADHAGRLAEAQDLNEQLAQGLKIAAPELTDPSVLWLPVSTRNAKYS